MTLRPDRRTALALCAVAFAAMPTRPSAQDEVPFITTPDRVTAAMLEIAGVGPRDHVIDLGSGDGRIVITAARRFGATGLGVEIVPDLVAKSRAHARAAGVADRTEFREQDLFATDLSRASVITMYLLPEVNLQLRPRLLQLTPGTRIVSHDWDLGDWAPDRTVTIDVPEKTIGRDKRSRVHLWTVPARVEGRWCGVAAGAGGSAGARPLQLEIAQRFQRFSATVTRPAAAGASVAQAGLRAPAPLAVFDGAIAGERLEASGPRAVTMRAGSGGLVVERSAIAELDGLRLVPAGPGGCG